MNDVRIEGTVTLIGGDRHPHASRRLREEWPSVAWAKGGSESNQPSVELTTSPELPEGAFKVTVAQSNGVPQIKVTGGPFSGTIYGVEELVQRLTSIDAKGVSLSSGTFEGVQECVPALFALQAEAGRRTAMTAAGGAI